MAAMTHALSDSVRHHHVLTTASLVVLFWGIAAVVVATIHVFVTPWSAGAGAVATTAALLLAAFFYTQAVARNAAVAHTLGVGISWLVLSILTEILLTRHLGHGWFSLLGSPDQPLLRNIYLFVWIFAPALFARSGDGD